jgi:dipeptidase D
LKGGHSGDDINKGRANANKVMARLLHKVWRNYDARLIDLKGGNLHNAIPRDAEALIAIPTADKERLRVDFNIFAAEIEDEFHVQETEVVFNLQSDEPIDGIQRMAIAPAIAKRVIWSLMAVHNGVLEMSQDIVGLVETSSNLASVRTSENELKVVTSQRSSTASALRDMCQQIAAIFELAGAKTEIGDGYPGWKPNMNSHLLKVAVDTYKQLFDKEPVVRAIHAGLECGLFSGKYPELDMVSVGPTLRGVHSPDECLLIPTVQMVWEHLAAILKNI